MPLVHYRAGINDSSRWNGFVFRPDDIVISVPSKCGTTWLQMICALLVFQSPELPAPLSSLSPWLDMRLRPIERVRSSLEAQPHRRFIKTHTPLDGLPAAPGVTYIVAGRDPRDVAVSMDHHGANLNESAIQRLLDSEVQTEANPPRRLPGGPPSGLEHQRERILQWIDDDTDPTERLGSLRGTIHHLESAWRRRHDPDVILVHYHDLTQDLDAQMREIARRLELTVPDDVWSDLVGAASLDQMRTHSEDLAPDEGLGLFMDNARFFRSGSTGQWRGILTDGDCRHYRERLRALASPDLADWVDSGGVPG